MKISILTLGCKVNQAESSFIEGSLKTAGYHIVALSESPDICIVNTCTVTARSDYQSRQLIRRAHRVGARVIVTGCYSELNKDVVKSMEGVEEIIDNNDKLNIITKLTGKDVDSFLQFPSSRSRLCIKIQDGCNYSCSYCTIPRARGRSRSLNPEVVVQQVNKAVSSDYNEIVLTGIHLGAYGNDLKHKVKLSDLLTTILKETKIKRIRLSSLEVKEIDGELLELFNDKRICKHLHIPLQSGDDNILKLMKRNYDSTEIFFKIAQISEKIPDISIGTDVIVGFPCEGELEFKRTYDLLEKLPITYMHIFPFSLRPGTMASEMCNNTSFSIKKERKHLLEMLNIKKKTEYMQRQVGKTLDVLIEKSNGDGTCSGTSTNYLKISMPQNRQSRGSLIYVRIQGIQKGRLFGIPI